jgi:hypothetical protein
MNIFAAISVWNSVEIDGQPKEDGLYTALYREGDGNLVVDLVCYDKEAHCGYGAPEGWYMYDENEGCEVMRDVVAYVPHNLDVASLEAVRSHFGERN